MEKEGSTFRHELDFVGENERGKLFQMQRPYNTCLHKKLGVEKCGQIRELLQLSSQSNFNLSYISKFLKCNNNQAMKQHPSPKELIGAHYMGLRAVARVGTARSLI